MCCHHHDLKTNKGFRLEPAATPGEYRLIPPDDG
jgi:hypothetical protein